MSYAVEVIFIPDSVYVDNTIVTKTHVSASFKEIEEYVLASVLAESKNIKTRLITVKLATSKGSAKYSFSRYYSKDSVREDLIDRNGLTATFSTPVMLRDALRILKNVC